MMAFVNKYFLRQDEGSSRKMIKWPIRPEKESLENFYYVTARAATKFGRPLLCNLSRIGSLDKKHLYIRKQSRFISRFLFADF